MNDKFDELAKGMAQSVTRRQALRRFGVGVVGAMLASLGLANKAAAGQPCFTDADCAAHKVCRSGLCAQSSGAHCNCHKAYYGCDPTDVACLQDCFGACSP